MRAGTRRELGYAVVPTAIGRVLLVGSAKGLSALRLADEAPLPELLDEIRTQNKDADLSEDAAGLKGLARDVAAVIEGSLPAHKIPLDVKGTPFQQRVWQELMRVPWGKTYSYSDLATKVGRPKAVRAVASACARNPVGFVVPCHRIVAKDGSLGGYYWGLERKRALLEREKV